MTLVLIWKKPSFRGLTCKTEVIWVLVLGIFIDYTYIHAYIHTSIHTYPPYIYDVERWYQHCKPCWRPNIFVNPFIAPQKSSLLQEIYSRGTGRCRIASSKAPIPGTWFMTIVTEKIGIEGVGLKMRGVFPRAWKKFCTLKIRISWGHVVLTRNGAAYHISACCFKGDEKLPLVVG